MIFLSSLKFFLVTFCIEEGIDNLVIEIQSSKAQSPINVKEDGSVISSRDVQRLNALNPIFCNNDGNKEGKKVISFSDVHSLKADSSIIFTDDGISIFWRELHFSKALLLITETEEGSSKWTSFKEEQLLNAFSPINLTDEFIVIFFNE